MRKSITLKTLFRAPVKTLLTFLLIAAASFALFSRVTDYAVTTREAAKAKSFYCGVAALDNSQSLVFRSFMIDGEEVNDVYFPDPKPWPTDEKIKEFSSLPGVTLADTRYMTEGLVENFDRIVDPEAYDETDQFILEGTYNGYEDISGFLDTINLTIDHVTVHAGKIKIDSDKKVQIYASSAKYLSVNEKNPFPRAFFEKLKKGSRCLIMGTYNFVSGGELYLNPLGDRNKAFRVLDGLGDNYLETEEFSYYKKEIEAINQAYSIYDIVYTKDMRAIPYFNERMMRITEGRPLTAEDMHSCTVSELFLKTYGLSVGDKIQIQLGDKLCKQIGLPCIRATNAMNVSNFVDTQELEIIGAYQFTSDIKDRYSEYEWGYSPSTIFVPVSLLPVEVPEDYEPSMGQFSVFIENPHDIKAFQEAAEPLVGEMGLGMRFSDGGWSNMEDSFEAGSLTSLLTTVLYVVGAIIALFLAVYLYIGRNKKTYAIMRTLGLSNKTARNSVALPLVVLSALGIPVGGIAGLFFASYTAAKTLASMSDNSAPEGYVYVLNVALPVEVVILCLIFELAVTLLLTLFFLQKMKRIPPLELLQESGVRVGATKKAEQDIMDLAPIPMELDMRKLSTVDQMPLRRKYSALRQVAVYNLRHMRRGIGKTAISLVLAIVLTAGIGMFVLAKLAYQDAFEEIDVKGRALEFSSDAIAALSKEDLIDDFYCYNDITVHVNGRESDNSTIITNNIDRYLTGNYKVNYQQGYDNSSLNNTGQLCLMGQQLAKELEIQLGDEIAVFEDGTYSFMTELYQKFKMEDKFAAAVLRESLKYKVVGLVEADDQNINTSIFVGINSGIEGLYVQPFSFNYCEFTLADNRKLTELNNLLEEQRKQGLNYAKMASYRIHSEALENIKRVRGLLESLFPIAVAAVVLIGVLGPGLVIMQSAKEAAFLRIMGVTKKRARCMLVSQQLFLFIVGLALVTGGLALFYPGLFARSAQTLATCFALYFIGCVCGALAAAIHVTRHRILELLQVKE